MNGNLSAGLVPFEVCPFGENVFYIKVQRRKVLSFTGKTAQRASFSHFSICRLPCPLSSLDSIILRSAQSPPPHVFLPRHIFLISNICFSKHAAYFTVFLLLQIFISVCSLCLSFSFLSSPPPPPPHLFSLCGRLTLSNREDDKV